MEMYALEHGIDLAAMDVEERGDFAGYFLAVVLPRLHREVKGGR